MQNMFNEIDDWCYKYLDTKNMKRFLMKTSMYPDETLLRAIVRHAISGSRNLIEGNISTAIPKLSATLRFPQGSL